MKGQTHAWTGIIFSAAMVVVVRDPQVVVPASAGVLIGSLLPDVDASNASYLERVAIRMLRSRNALIRLFGFFVVLMIMPFRLLVILLNLPHRGPLHSPLFALAWVVAGVVVALFSAKLMGFFLSGVGVGVFLHLLGDSLTRSGVNFFGYRVRGPFKTGGLWEYAVIALAIFGLFLLLVLTNGMRG